VLATGGPKRGAPGAGTLGLMAVTSVRRVDFGYFVRPATDRGGAARVEPVLGYLVDHPEGLLLFDTGMGGNREIDAYFRPRRHTLEAALSALDTAPDEVRFVANCHLHFDHCGGNPQLAGRPLFVQETELATALTRERYTLPELVERPDILYEQVSGETEILPGVLLVPTPGHTEGHQSLVVRRGDGTVIVLAGQSHDTGTDYAADVLAWRGHRDGHAPPLPVPPAWMDRLQRLDPAAVYFAHDHVVWAP
jgi:N-acyl homoserine lactone hydrolase